MKRITFIALIFVIIVLAISVNAGRRDQKALEARLAYLKDTFGVLCVVFDKNNVYIGFETVDNDMGMIVRGAAVQGNKAYGAGVHVWAMNANKGDWKTAPHFCTATARKGRITKSDCR